MVVTSTGLDQELGRWQQRIDLMSQAVLKLHDHPTYQQLSAELQVDLDAQRLLARAQQIFEQFDRLLEIINQARQHRENSSGLLSSHQGLEQAQKLLIEASVPCVLSSTLSLPDTSLSLLKSCPPLSLSPVEYLKPDEVLAQLSRSYQQLWSDLLQRHTQLEQQATEFRQQLIQAQQDLQQLEMLYHSASSFQEEYEQKIASQEDEPPGLPPLTRVKTMWQSLDYLQKLGFSETAAASNGQEAIAKLQRWQQQQQDLRLTVEISLKFFSERLNLRRELRGRLNALQAKAQAKGKIEDPLLSQLAAQAKATLYSRPTFLQQAVLLVQQYEQQLNQ